MANCAARTDTWAAESLALCDGADGGTALVGIVGEVEGSDEGGERSRSSVSIELYPESTLSTSSFSLSRGRFTFSSESGSGVG